MFYTLQEIQLVFEGLALFILAIYVLGTFYMAWATHSSVKEMKLARVQENQPQVMAYFDIPYGESMIYFIIKNLGKTPAQNLEISMKPKINPEIIDKVEEIEVNFNKFVSKKYSYLPSQFQIKTSLNTTFTIMGNPNIPKEYEVNLKYFSDFSQKPIIKSYLLDITMFSEVMYSVEKGTGDIVKELKNISSKLSKLK